MDRPFRSGSHCAARIKLLVMAVTIVGAPAYIGVFAVLAWYRLGTTIDPARGGQWRRITLVVIGAAAFIGAPAIAGTT